MSSTFLVRLPRAFLLSCLIALGAASGVAAAPQSSAKLGAPVVEEASALPQPDPGSLFDSHAPIGSTLRFIVVGSTHGGVWGDGTYTSDSVLGAAAVHAGLLQPGEAGIVTVEIVEGLPAYQGTQRHGVTSLSYGSWDTAYRLTAVEPIDGGATLPDPGNLSAYRDRVGATLTFEVTGSTEGAVWGSGVYTDDSVLAAAAVHAGALKAGETGLVTVEILAGQSSYEASDANGVSSQSYGPWDGSFRIASPSSKAGSKLTN